jgi:hypothetical protein
MIFEKDKRLFIDLFSISIDKDFGATVHRKTDDWLKSQ